MDRQITILDILEERKKALMKCDVLSVQYSGSEKTKEALFNMLEPLVALNSDRVHYIETCGRNSETTLEELHTIFNSVKAIQVSNVEERFKKCRGAKYDILSCETFIEKKCKVHDTIINSMRAELNIFHNELNLIDDFCVLGVYFTYDVESRTSKIPDVGFMSKHVIGKEAVEEMLNKGIRLCWELTDDLGLRKPTRTAEWAEKRSIVTYI